MQRLLLSWSVPFIAWDDALFKFINSHHSAVFDVIFWSCSTFGSGWGIIPAYLLFIILKAPKTRLWFIITVSAVTLIVGGLLSTTIKRHVDRYRPTIYFVSPSATTGLSAAPPPADAARVFAVHNIGPRYRDHSFPSGHTWAACTISMLMVLFFGRKYWWTFLIAAAIGYSRIYVGVHFPSDVVAGGCLGSLLAFFVWRIAVWIAPHKARA
jgi:undecaprenyl-diphosphatase